MNEGFNLGFRDEILKTIEYFMNLESDFVMLTDGKDYIMLGQAKDNLA